MNNICLPVAGRELGRQKIGNTESEVGFARQTVNLGL